MFHLRTDKRCFPHGERVPLLSSSSNQTTVEREVVEFSCTFKDNYSPTKYGVVYWTVMLQNGSSNTVFVQDDDIHQDSFCHFTINLYRNATMSLNDAMITCTASADNMPSSSNASYLSEFHII